MPQEPTEIERVSRELELVCGTLVGLGVIALVQMLGLQSFDVLLKVSVCSFAIAIPALTSFVLCLREEAKRGKTTRSPLLAILAIAGLVSSFIGISCLFFHFAIYAGILFLLISIIGLVASVRYERALERL